MHPSWTITVTVKTKGPGKAEGNRSVCVWDGLRKNPPDRHERERESG